MPDAPEYRQQTDAAGRPVFDANGVPILIPATPKQSMKWPIIIGFSLLLAALIAAVIYVPIYNSRHSYDESVERAPTSTLCADWDSLSRDTKYVTARSLLNAQIAKVKPGQVDVPRKELVESFVKDIGEECDIGAAMNYPGFTINDAAIIVVNNLRPGYYF